MSQFKILLKVTAIYCYKCKHYVYSCANHDYRRCHCGAVSIDGGTGPICGFSYSPDSKYRLTKLVVKASTKDLYDDWNYQNQVKRRFGLVHKSKVKRLKKKKI